MAVRNCSSERSFSCLKGIKTYLRSSMSESRLNDIAVLSIQSDTTNSISFDDVIKIFIEINSDEKCNASERKGDIDLVEYQ